MGWSLGNRKAAVKQYQKYVKKWKEKIKAIKKQKRIIFRMDNHFVSHFEPKDINKICAKASKKHDYSINNISIGDYYSSLSSDSERY